MNTLIAFVGKAQSGKNTAARFLSKYMGYKEVSFAAALKKVVCEIYGLNLKKLEDDRYKSTPHPYLNPMAGWKRLLYRFGINLAPKDGVTPRQVLQRIAEEGFGEDPKYSYALKQLRRCPKLLELIKFVYDVPNYKKANYIRNTGLTLGDIYSQIGYKGFSALYQDTWVDKLFREISTLQKDGKKIVITDCRRPYELDRVLEKGGIGIYIDRPQHCSKDTHASEQVEPLREKCSLVLFNSYSEEYLYMQLEKALVKR